MLRKVGWLMLVAYLGGAMCGCKRASYLQSQYELVGSDSHDVASKAYENLLSAGRPGFELLCMAAIDKRAAIRNGVGMMFASTHSANGEFAVYLQGKVVSDDRYADLFLRRWLGPGLELAATAQEDIEQSLEAMATSGLGADDPAKKINEIYGRKIGYLWLRWKYPKEMGALPFDPVASERVRKQQVETIRNRFRKKLSEGTPGTGKGSGNIEQE